MRVLIVTFGDVRKANVGYLIRVSNFIKCIEGENLKVIQFINDKESFTKEEDEENTNNIITIKTSKNYFFTGLSILINSLRFSNLVRWSEVVIFEGSIFVPFGIMARLMGKKVIHDFHGSIVEISREMKGFRNFAIRRVIGGTLDKLAVIIANVTTAVSDRDSELVKKMWERAKTFTVVHGLDINKIPFLSNKNEKMRRLIFVGNLKAVNNLVAVENLIKIAKDLPNVEFLIIGDGKELIKDPPLNVKLLGKVDSLDSYYDEADACIVPITVGTGVKTKVLECMAYGKPVITTEKGIEGLEKARNIKGMYVVPLEEMSKIVDKIKLEKTYPELRAFVRENFSLATTCRQLREVLESLYGRS
ncbi:MAG: glycosyltransferase family 4 protein [Candidatus Aramenus sp.]|jgi:glycosyltransferase involved in cell wall biosynthesis|nr:glycosyltransferase family 4 protein [Candidatus Aramenus sp.]